MSAPSSPPVRILLATWNGAAHLSEQLDSYLAQDHGNWALWVSDDGSDDGTWEILEDFRAAHPDREIRLLRGPGQGAAANFLSLLTHPELPPGPVALSDQDDVWKPCRLSRGLAAVHVDAGPALYGAITTETTPAIIQRFYDIGAEITIFINNGGNSLRITLTIGDGNSNLATCG